VSHGECFAGSGNTEQDLVSPANQNSVGDCFDRRWLITIGLIFGYDVKYGHMI
jgi:hypothetical protein